MAERADDPELHAEGEQLRQQHEEAKHPGGNGKAGHRFALVRFKDILLSKSTPYLVEGLIPREGLVVVWGPPKSGKTFWMFDIGMHVALAWDYRGRRVEPGAVIYVAAEGERGLSARKEAFQLKRLAGSPDADPPFYLLRTRLNLAGDVEALILDIRAQLGVQTCVLVIIDTLNRTIAGSESDDRDMTSYVSAADRLRESFQAAVAIIHHCGTNERRPRGHTSLTGAGDAQLAVKKEPSSDVVVTVEYMKDGPEGEEIRSRLVPVEVGSDDNGAPITSCVIEPIESTANNPNQASKKASGKLSDKHQIALAALKKAIADAGSPAPASNHIPTNATVVSVDLWRRYYLMSTSGDSDQSEHTRRKSMLRARDALKAREIIGTWEEVAWIV